MLEKMHAELAHTSSTNVHDKINECKTPHAQDHQPAANDKYVTSVTVSNKNKLLDTNT